MGLEAGGGVVRFCCPSPVSAWVGGVSSDMARLRASLAGIPLWVFPHPSTILLPTRCPHIPLQREGVGSVVIAGVGSFRASTPVIGVL